MNNNVNVNVEKVLDKLAMEIGQLIKDKAILVQINEEKDNMINGLQEEIELLKKQQKQPIDNEEDVK